MIGEAERRKEKKILEKGCFVFRKIEKDEKKKLRKIWREGLREKKREYLCILGG